MVRIENDMRLRNVMKVFVDYWWRNGLCQWNPEKFWDIKENSFEFYMAREGDIDSFFLIENLGAQR